VHQPVKAFKHINKMMKS